jgi:hypothetical protein
VACATPLPGFHLEQTRATLDFAARAAHIVCTPQRNVVALDPPADSGEAVAAMQGEVVRLREALAAQAAECEALRARLTSGCGGDPAAAAAAVGPASALERLKRLSLKRGGGGSRGHSGGGAGAAWPGVAGPGSLAGGSGACSGARTPELASVGGAHGDDDRSSRARAASAISRQSLPGVSPVGSLLWRMLHPNRSTDGLGSLLDPASSDGHAAPQHRGCAGGLLHTTGSMMQGWGGAGRSEAAAHGACERKWASQGGITAPRSGGGLRRNLSLGGCEVGAAAAATAQRAEALNTGGSARRVTDGDCSAEGHASAAARDASLREHIIRQLVALLQQKKGEVRALKENVASLAERLAAAEAEHAAKDERLRQMVEGIARLGAARHEEFATWSSHLAGLEAAVVAAQQEALAYRDEATGLQAALAEATARYTAQAEQLRRTSLVVLQTGHALADAKVG